MCSCTVRSSLYMRVKLPTHNVFSNLDTAGDVKFRFQGRLKWGMYLHLQHNAQIIYMRREPVWKMISEMTLLRWQIQWQTQEVFSDINFWSKNGCNSYRYCGSSYSKCWDLICLWLSRNRELRFLRNARLTMKGAAGIFLECENLLEFTSINF